MRIKRQRLQGQFEYHAGKKKRSVERQGLVNGEALRLTSPWLPTLTLFPLSRKGAPPGPSLQSALNSWPGQILEEKSDFRGLPFFSYRIHTSSACTCHSKKVDSLSRSPSGNLYRPFPILLQPDIDAAIENAGPKTNSCA